MSKTLEELKEIAINVIQAGHMEGHDDDTVRMEMFKEGIPFSKINSLFKSTRIDLGLVVDPKVVTEGLNELIQDIPWEDYSEWSQIEEAITALTDNVDGATSGRALSLVRAYCRNEEVELPRKPKAASTTGGTRVSKLADAIVSLVVANPQATKQEAFEVVYPLTSGKNQYKNAMHYVNTVFSVAQAAATGSVLSDVVANLASQEDPAGGDEADDGME